MEFSKKTLIKIMEEVNSTYVDEMALRTGGKSYLSKDPTPRKQAPRTKDGKFKPIFAVPGWHPSNETPKNGYGIPDYWIINPTNQLGNEELIVPIDCEDIEDFRSRNSEWLESLHSEYGIEPQLFICRERNKPTGKVVKPPYAGVLTLQTHGIEAGVNLPSYELTGGPKGISVQERIFRYGFYPLMRNNFEKGEFAKILELKSIPCVSVDPKHLDTHQESVTNEKFRFRAHSYELFKEVEDFIEIVRFRRNSQKEGGFTPERDPVLCTRIARQYNRKYKNWEKERKNRAEYEGKTPKYLLDRFGLEEGNLNLATRLDIIIDGDLNEENKTYKWNVLFIVSFGKKVEEEMTIYGGIQTEREFRSSKEVSYELGEPYREFNNNYTIMNNPSIKTGLIEALDDIKNQMSSLKSNWMLNTATQARLDIR